MTTDPTPTHWTWLADERVEDLRVDKAIALAIEGGLGDFDSTQAPGASRSQIQKLIERGLVRVDKQTIEAKSKLRPGQTVEVEFPAPVPLEAKAQDLPIEKLYEDAHLLVVNKPQGLTVHPSTTQADGTLVNALLFHVKDLSGIGGTLRPGIVHRIDKNTSGALVITKTDLAHQILMKTFAEHRIERAYWALCYGVPKDRSGKIETLIGRNPADRKKMTTQVKSGRKAISHYKVLETFHNEKGHGVASWIEVRLETGRTHQVRVHLTSIGHSIIGDPVYGAPTEKHAKWVALSPAARAIASQLPGQALHARILGFDHPVTGKKLHFEAEPPAVFTELLQGLRGARP